MNEPGDGPIRVLWIQERSPASGSVPTRLDDAEDLAVERSSDVDSTRAVLESSQFDCVVVGDVGSDDDVIAAVRDVVPVCPIVLAPAEPAPRAASDALRNGATHYLPESVATGPTELPDLIREAATSTVEHRERRRESERYRALMSEMPLSIAFKDEQSRIVDIADSPMQDEDVDPVGKTEVEIWDEMSAESYANDRHVVETGEPILDDEIRYEVGPDTYWQSETKVPWRDDGEVVGSMGVTYDVTDYKEREQGLRKRVSRLEAFASFVSHDLRNPLTVASGYLDLARSADDPNDRAAAFDKVEEALETMDGLVDDLLAMVRPDESDVSAEPVDLPALVDDVWAGIDADAASLRNEIPDETRIDAVEGQLRQLCSNFFRNSIEHAGPDVDVVVGLSEAGFYVADDGPGLAVDDPDTVFEYGHTSTGTGVGLALVREIAESHDWSVSAGESEAGGARFAVTDCLIRTPSYRGAEEGEPVELSTTVDVGGSTPPGEAALDDGTWTLRGGGEDLWADFEEHYVVAGELEPPLRVVATVVDLEHVHDYSKAGVMIRADETTGSPLQFATLTAAHGTEFGWRTNPADDEIRTVPFEDFDGPPRRYRLDLFDSRATASVETDQGWQALQQRPFRSRGSILAGTTVCGHDTDRHCEAVFEDVRVVPLDPAAPSE